jgi:CheY-like chemotaxis protein
MPGLDGIALAERASALCPAIHIIMMSGYTGMLDKARSLKARSVRFLAKPFSIDKVRTEVRAALG